MSMKSLADSGLIPLDTRNEKYTYVRSSVRSFGGVTKSCNAQRGHLSPVKMSVL